MHLEELERTLNTISQLLSTRTNIYNIVIQEVIGWGKFRTVAVRLSKREIKTKLKVLDSLFQRYFICNDLIGRFGRLDDNIR